jgi:alpha-methylacyl-CoA racemase
MGIPRTRGPLAGTRVIELAGIGPGPFAGLLLADLGAEVILVERPARPGDPLDLGRNNICNRGKRSICLDLKNPAAVELVLALVSRSEALIEGMRPGVMERLGLGPDVCFAKQPKLVYGRMTGWTSTISRGRAHSGTREQRTTRRCRHRRWLAISAAERCISL